MGEFSSFDVFAVVLGGVAVVLFARKCFDTPHYPFDESEFSEVVFAPRYLTSRPLYLGLMAFYMMLMLVLYVGLAALLYFVPTVGGELIPFLPQFPTDQVARAASLLMAALVLTSLLPNIEPVAALEGRLRKRLHLMALIPKSAQALHVQLGRAGFLDESARQALRPEGLDPTALRGEDPIRARWARVLCLRHAVATWSRQIDSYMKSPESGWVVIEESQASLRAAIDIYQKQVKERGDSFDRALEASLERQIFRLHRFLSCALLRYEPTEGQRNARMQGLGFQLDDLKLIGWDQISLILIELAAWVFAVTLVMAIGLHALGWSHYMDKLSIKLEGPVGSLAWTSVALLFHGGAVLAVLLVKRRMRKSKRWPVPERPLAPDERPWLLYVGVGLLAGVVTELVLVASAPFSPGPFQPWWAFLAIPTAFVLAFHIDTHPDTAHPVLQASTQLGVTALVTYVSAMTGLEIHGWIGASVADRVCVGFLVVQAALTGGFIGYWVPGRYRQLVFAGHRPVAAPPLEEAPAQGG